MIKSFLAGTLSNSILPFAQLRVFTEKLFGNTECGAENVVVPPLFACHLLGRSKLYSNDGEI